MARFHGGAERRFLAGDVPCHPHHDGVSDRMPFDASSIEELDLSP
ncbi:hypothetical protein [Sorangium cellulosum]|nr:hypothetical protein [Sorangium cellulosum]